MKGDELLFRVMNPKRSWKLEKPNYALPVYKWQVLEYVAKHQPDWWAKDKEVYSHEYELLNYIISSDFIAKLQQHLANYILEHRDEKCNVCRHDGVSCRSMHLPDGTYMSEIICDSCNGTGKRWSAEIVKLAKEVLNG